MVTILEIKDFLFKSSALPIIDVRSPGEFQQGHIPDAINLPLFDNNERAIVGTIYKNSGHDAAVLKGLELAGPKMAAFVKSMYQIAPRREIFIHCWRGGMRSEHMAWLFDQCGFSTTVLNGGYKAYRKYIRESFSCQSNIIILGGLTGSGKTQILHQLSAMGEQILDLESLSCHKGSVFGAMGQKPQPTNEQFENDIYSQWKSFDFSKIIWIEDESRSIGSVIIPDPLFLQMNRAPMIKIEISREIRVERLVKEYAGFEPSLLKDAILKISEKLGGTRTGLALQSVEKGDFASAVEPVLEYYDKTYHHAVSKRVNQNIRTFESDTDDAKKNAALLSSIIHQ